jgi:hypothetical protein
MFFYSEGQLIAFANQWHNQDDGIRLDCVATMGRRLNPPDL